MCGWRRFSGAEYDGFAREKERERERERENENAGKWRRSIDGGGDAVVVAWLLAHNPLAQPAIERASQPASLAAASLVLLSVLTGSGARGGQGRQEDIPPKLFDRHKPLKSALFLPRAAAAWPSLGNGNVTVPSTILSASAINKGR